MTEDKVEPDPEPRSRRDRATEYVKNNWKPITIGAVSAAVTIGAIIVAKRVIFPNQTAMLIKKMTIKDSVFYIQTYARRMGPPSYLIENIRTGDKWNSQLDLATDLGISPSRVSSAFGDTNGTVAIINGEHYVRRAVMVPRNG